MSLKPRALQPGARLAVVAPASAFGRAEFDQGIEEIRRLGFEPVYDESVFDKQRYLAGSPETRARAIETAWRDPSIAGLIGVRGGYGSAQVLPSRPGGRPPRQKAVYWLQRPDGDADVPDDRL